MHTQRRKQHSRAVVVSVYFLLLMAAVLVQRSRSAAVEAELAACRASHDQFTQAAQRLGEVQLPLAAARTQADLVAWLSHPWPKTQVLAAVLQSFPDSIVLDELEVHRLSEQSPTAAALVRDQARAGTEEKDESKRPAAQRDLNRLRGEFDLRATVVSLAGRTRDVAALHACLGRLAQSGLVAKVELPSIESLEGQLGWSKFSARAVLVPGYGQPGGPEGKQSQPQQTSQTALHATPASSLSYD
jgi:hypothetical protein